MLQVNKMENSNKRKYTAAVHRSMPSYCVRMLQVVTGQFVLSQAFINHVNCSVSVKITIPNEADRAFYLQQQNGRPHLR